MPQLSVFAGNFSGLLKAATMPAGHILVLNSTAEWQIYWDLSLAS